MFELIWQDMRERLNTEDWIALLAVLSMVTTPYIIVGCGNLKDAIKKQINKKLAVHGLRLR